MLYRPLTRSRDNIGADFRRFFHAFIAVHSSSIGLSAVFNWLTELLANSIDDTSKDWFKSTEILTWTKKNRISVTLLGLFMLHIAQEVWMQYPAYQGGWCIVSSWLFLERKIIIWVRARLRRHITDLISYVSVPRVTTGCSRKWWCSWRKRGQIGTQVWKDDVQYALQRPMDI